ncbi:hypothetical protein ACJX0J_037534, partial [Zea mays]
EDDSCQFPHYRNYISLLNLKKTGLASLAEWNINFFKKFDRWSSIVKQISLKVINWLALNSSTFRKGGNQRWTATGTTHFDVAYPCANESNNSFSGMHTKIEIMTRQPFLSVITDKIIFPARIAFISCNKVLIFFKNGMWHTSLYIKGLN